MQFFQASFQRKSRRAIEIRVVYLGIFLRSASSLGSNQISSSFSTPSKKGWGEVSTSFGALGLIICAAAMAHAALASACAGADTGASVGPGAFACTLVPLFSLTATVRYDR